MMPIRRRRAVFNITDHVERIVVDLCARIPEFAHVDPARVLVCAARARGATLGGTYAKIIPMRFDDGSPLKVVGEKRYALPQIPTPQGDVMYLIYIYLPRFFAQPFERRLLTLIHELYHIAPSFDGTIRRIGSRAHGASRAQFNANLQPLVDQYLAGEPAEELLEVLRGDFAALCREKSVVGRALQQPKAVRLS